MKMGHTYGFFEEEIDVVLARIRRHDPLHEIEAMKCPCCGAAITVQFSGKGNLFEVACSGIPPHWSTCQKISAPPPWWTKRVVDAKPVTFYWLRDHRFEANGKLVIPASGWDGEDSHWSGCLEIESDNADYGFWQWMIKNERCFDELITDEDLVNVRKKYDRKA